jgi:hypothetical protein
VETSLAQAEAVISQTGALVFAPQIHEARAEIARLLGDEAEGERQLREAHRLYSEMGATGHADRLTRELRR